MMHSRMARPRRGHGDHWRRGTRGHGGREQGSSTRAYASVLQGKGKVERSPRGGLGGEPGAPETKKKRWPSSRQRAALRSISTKGRSVPPSFDLPMENVTGMSGKATGQDELDQLVR